VDVLIRESGRLIEEHLTDFKAKMEAAGRSPRHIRSTIKYISEIADAAGFLTAGDVSADGVVRYAAELKDKGKSARTIQARLIAVKAFTRWLAEHGKLPADPLASVKKPNPKKDRRRERRMLLPEEFRRVRRVTEVQPERFGMAARERALLYTLAVQTALRPGELRDLTAGSLFLDGPDRPFVVAKASVTKNAKQARQYMKAALADELREHLRTKAPKAPIFRMPRSEDVAQMFRADVAAARAAWLEEAKHDPDEYEQRTKSDFLTEKNHEGESLDFYSLRHSTGSWAALAGAHPKEVQRIMRHSTITLTMDTYSHLFPGQEAETVNRLPDLDGEADVLRATGTDDVGLAPVFAGSSEPAGNQDRQRKRQHSGHDAMRVGATMSERNTTGDHASRVSSALRRTRTCNPLIKSQLLCQIELAGQKEAAPVSYCLASSGRNLDAVASFETASSARV